MFPLDKNNPRKKDFLQFEQTIGITGGQGRPPLHLPFIDIPYRNAALQHFFLSFFSDRISFTLYE
jgi:hypothetical protein